MSTISGTRRNTSLCHVCKRAGTTSFCAGCGAVPYCSRGCQKRDWKSHHKNVCKFVCSSKVPNGKKSQTLPLDTKIILDFDGVLDFASKYMNKLQRVSLTFEQEHVLNISYSTSFGGSHDEDTKVQLISDSLLNFLRSMTDKLESITWRMQDCCWEQTRRMTGDGTVWRALAPCVRLNSLTLYEPVFRDVEDLTYVLDSRCETLKQLTLGTLTLGSPSPESWSSRQCELLAQSISRCKGLVKLCLHEVHFRDRHVEVLLEDLPDLRCLEMGGNYAPQHPGGYLTDRTCRYIANNCPNIQSLQLHYHRQMTSSGVAQIFQKCSHLREFLSSAEEGGVGDLPRLFARAPKTLLVFGDVQPGTPGQLVQAVEATRGRTLLYCASMGVMDVPGLSAQSREQFANSKRILKEVAPKRLDATVHNEWEDYF